MSDPRPLVVAWGELLWDLFPDGPRLGGAAANVAVHARTLGARAALISRVGDDDLGRRAATELAARGVDVTHVQVDRDAPTGTVEVTLDDGEPRFRMATSAAWDRIEGSDAVRALIASADVLVHGTLAQRTPLARGALGAILREASPTLRRVCDVNLRPPHVSRDAVESCVRGASAVKLNDAEARHIEALFDAPDAVVLLRQTLSVALVALTRGAQGATLFGEARVDAPAVAIDEGAGDRVGAGDAFTAVLAVELARGSPPSTIAARANRYAAWVASQPGAMPPPPPWLSADGDGTMTP